MSFSEMPMQDNLRSEPRLPHYETVYVEILSSCAMESEQMAPELSASETIDVSANGLQVRFPKPLQVGTILQLCIVRERTGDKFELAAEIMWQRRLPGTAGWLAGFRLFESDDTSIVDWKLAVAAMLGDEHSDHVVA